MFCFKGNNVALTLKKLCLGMVQLSQGYLFYCFHLEDRDLCIGYDYTTAESETEIFKTFLF